MSPGGAPSMSMKPLKLRRMAGSAPRILPCLLSDGVLPPLPRRADEVSAIVGAARALVSCDLAVGAQGTRLVDLAAGPVRGGDLSWALALFDPLFHHLHFV